MIGSSKGAGHLPEAKVLPCRLDEEVKTAPIGKLEGFSLDLALGMGESAALTVSIFVVWRDTVEDTVIYGWLPTVFVGTGWNQEER